MLVLYQLHLKVFIRSLRIIADRIAIKTTLLEIRTAFMEAGILDNALNVRIWYKKKPTTPRPNDTNISLVGNSNIF